MANSSEYTLELENNLEIYATVNFFKPWIKADYIDLLLPSGAVYL